MFAKLLALCFSIVLVCAINPHVPIPAPFAPMTFFYNSSFTAYGIGNFTAHLPGLLTPLYNVGPYPAVYAVDLELGCLSFDNAITIQFTCANGTYTKLPVGSAFQWFYDANLGIAAEILNHMMMFAMPPIVVLPSITVRSDPMPDGKPITPQLGTDVTYLNIYGQHRGWSVNPSSAVAAQAAARGDTRGNGVKTIIPWTGMPKDAGAVGHGLEITILQDAESGYPISFQYSGPSIEGSSVDTNGCVVCNLEDLRGSGLFQYTHFLPYADRAVLQLPPEALVPNLPRYSDLGGHCA